MPMSAAARMMMMKKGKQVKLGNEANAVAKKGGGPFKPNNSAGVGGMNLVPKKIARKRSLRRGR